MIGLPSSVKIYLATGPTDLRKGFNGLSGIVREWGLDLFSGHLFVFRNRNRDRLKILYWDRDGLAIWYKRLEKQRFKWPTDHTADTLTLNGEQLNWLLDGFDLWNNQPHQSLYFSSVG